MCCWWHHVNSTASFYLLAGHMLSTRILASASAADLEQALDAVLMPQSMVGVQVQVPGGALCDAASPVTVELTIPDVYGNTLELQVVQIGDASVPGMATMAAVALQCSARRDEPRRIHTHRSSVPD